MTLIHKGVRPLHFLTLLDFKKSLYYEEYPDGTGKIWTTKMLNSGCGFVLKTEPRELRECWYCPRCDEYFSKSQWEGVE